MTVLSEPPGPRPETGLAVLIPALNEAASVGKVVAAIPVQFSHRVLVVDNGSTDGTATAARAAGATVILEPHRGYGAACLKGLAELQKDPPMWVVFLDADYSDHPDEMIAVTEPVINGTADLVIGSRVRGAREPGALTPQARFGNMLATFLIRRFFGVHFTDLGPFRALSWRALEKIQMRDEGYGWTVEMQVKAAKLGLACTEVPVSYRKRLGKSKVSGTVRGVLGAGTKILWVIFREALRR